MALNSGNPNASLVIAPTLKADIELSGLIYVAPEPNVVRQLRVTLVAIMIGMENHSYHNFPHGCQVYAFTKFLLDSLSIEGVERDVTEIGALLHDFGHCGSTHRQLVYKGDPLSNEEFACYHVDPLVRNVFSTGYRLQLQGIILATSFGQNTQPIEDPLYRPYRPVTLSERVVALADVGVAFGDFSEYLRTASLLARECGKSTYKEVVTFLLAESQLEFFDIVRERLKALVELGCNESTRLEVKLRDNKMLLEALIRNPSKIEQYNYAIASAGVVIE